MKTTESMGPAPPGHRQESKESQALNRIADALERLADVYLYCNDPEGGEGAGGSEQPPLRSLPDGFKGMR